MNDLKQGSKATTAGVEVKLTHGSYVCDAVMVDGVRISERTVRTGERITLPRLEAERLLALKVAVRVHD